MVVQSRTWQTPNLFVPKWLDERAVPAFGQRAEQLTYNASCGSYCPK